MAARSDRPKRPTRQRQPKAAADKAGSEIPTTARDLRRKPPADLAAERQRAYDQCDAGKSNHKNQDLNAPPPDLAERPQSAYISELFSKRIVADTIELAGPGGRIVLSTESCGALATFYDTHGHQRGQIGLGGDVFGIHLFGHGHPDDDMDLPVAGWNVKPDGSCNFAIMPLDDGDPIVEFHSGSQPQAIIPFLKSKLIGDDTDRPKEGGRR